MLKSCTRYAVVAGVVTLAGCGSSGGGASLAIEDFASESAKVSCHRIYTCCDATERAADTTWGPTEADCVATMTTQFAAAVATYQTGITAGKIVYHGDRAQRCLDNVAALSCADWGINFNRRFIPDCAHVADGTVALAGACTIDEECASGFCSASVCAARGAVGDACTSPSACADGLYCPVSAGDHCVAAGAIGGACEVSVSCQNSSCVIPDGATAGTCGSPMTCNGV